MLRPATGVLRASLVLLLALPPAALAVVPEAGTVYEGGTFVESPELGLGFLVPDGWRGQLSPDEELFVMVSSRHPGMLLAYAEETTLDETVRTMSAPVDLGDGVRLEPLGELDRRAGFLSREFEVHGASPPAAAYARAIHSEGVTVSFVALVPEASIADGRRWVARLHTSLKRVAPPAPPAGGGASSGSSTSDRWDDYLRGKHLVRFYTTTGFTSERHLWLCSDGSFAYSDESGGFGGGASGAFAGSSRGRWTATGVGDHGSLLLEYADGGTATYELTYRDGKVLLDGDHWLRDANSFCR
ncbi:MAG: hypothetical protein R3325_16465 [Thermoanaerobaculia bacterium]|nr:hypothetical protein [Thermoanaerobaculia bacterium]